MVSVAACTDKGVKRSVNQDACCVQVAHTVFGEVAMAIVCDGVGGLSAGELASATVAYRFAQWFREELPALLTSMDTSRPLDLDMIQMVWGIMLTSLNGMIQAHGRVRSEMLGTTFSGLFLCDSRYLIAHVGDCRVYQLGSRGVRQITEDQTLLARKLAAGEISAEEARSFGQKHVILQSVGTEGILRPSFYSGSFAQSDLFVMCCDGAYRKAEEQGIHTFFEGVDRSDDDALTKACQDLLAYDIMHGEKDNLTVVCVSGALDAAGLHNTGRPLQVRDATLKRSFDASGLSEDDGEDPITMMHEEAQADEDLPTVVEPQAGADEDLPTMVEPQAQAGGDEDLPTLIEGGA